MVIEGRGDPGAESAIVRGERLRWWHECFVVLLYKLTMLEGFLQGKLLIQADKVRL